MVKNVKVVKVQKFLIFLCKNYHVNIYNLFLKNKINIILSW